MLHIILYVGLLTKKLHAEFKLSSLKYYTIKVTALVVDLSVLKGQYGKDPKFHISHS